MTRIVDEQLAGPIDWSDADEAVETTLEFMQRASSDTALLRCVVEGLERGEIAAQRSSVGAVWFLLAKADAPDLRLWLRFCPRGAVVAPHAHAEPFVATVLSGTYKQTLIGVGGGVASPEQDSPLAIRTECLRQVFSLAAGQRHSSASSVGTALLVAMPAAGEGPGPGLIPVTDQRELRTIARKLASALRAS